MKFSENHYATMICLFVLFALGFAGWYENYVPAPQVDLDRIYTAQSGNGR